MDYEEYNDYIDYNITNSSPTSGGKSIFPAPGSGTLSPLTTFLAVVNIMTCVLGLAGNSLVIWICGWKMKRMNKKVIMIWYISLAVSNLLFCAFLPFSVYYSLTKHWPFGLLLCKMTSLIVIFNMYSSVFILVLISIDRFVMVMFPVWSHKHRSPWKASVMVALMWALSALLSFPAVIYRSTITHNSITQCHTNYMKNQHRAIALTRFVFGFVFPFLIIAGCGVGLVMKLKNKTLKSAKPYKIVSALIGSFFVCWVPFHIFVLMEVDFLKHNIDVIRTGLEVGQTLAAANSFISAVLYVFVSNEFKATLKRSLTSRTEAELADLTLGRSKSTENSKI